MPGMSDAERLRERSKRMLELASRAYCEKNYGFARMLLELATEVLEHASEMDPSHEAQSRRETTATVGKPRVVRY